MFRATFVPTIPGEQRDSEHRGQRHIHRRGARKANYSRCRSSHQGAIKLKSRPKAPQKKIDGDRHQRGIQRRGNTSSPVAYPRNAVDQHRFPVIENGFLQPRLAIQEGCNPITPCEHFARYLRIAGLISTDQAEISETPEK